MLGTARSWATLASGLTVLGSLACGLSSSAHAGSALVIANPQTGSSTTNLDQAVITQSQAAIRTLQQEGFAAPYFALAANGARMSALWQQFMKSAAQSGEAVVYFIGPAISLNAANYLLSSDAKSSVADSVKENELRLGHIITALEQRRPNGQEPISVILLDIITDTNEAINLCVESVTRAGTQIWVRYLTPDQVDDLVLPSIIQDRLAQARKQIIETKMRDSVCNVSKALFDYDGTQAGNCNGPPDQAKRCLSGDYTVPTPGDKGLCGPLAPVWHDRGATLALSEVNGEVTITFNDPGENWSKQGVDTGSVFFKGTRDCSLLTGRRYAYSPKCTDGVGFDVTGKLENAKTIEFRGEAPLTLGNKCQVKKRNPDYELTITTDD